MIPARGPQTKLHYLCRRILCAPYSIVLWQAGGLETWLEHGIGMGGSNLG